MNVIDIGISKDQLSQQCPIQARNTTMAKIPKTEFAEHAFTVKESKSGPFIACEPRREDLSILGDGFLTP